MNKEEIKYQKAINRVEELKGFYFHLAIYVVVNLILFLINMMTSPENLWFFWVPIGWGIGLAIHALYVFVFNSKFGAGWEEKKIKEIIEKE